jgi:hypothetical protein
MQPPALPKSHTHLLHAFIASRSLIYRYDCNPPAHRKAGDYLCTSRVPSHRPPFHAIRASISRLLASASHRYFGPERKVTMTGMAPDYAPGARHGREYSSLRHGPWGGYHSLLRAASISTSSSLGFFLVLHSCLSFSFGSVHTISHDAFYLYHPGWPRPHGRYSLCCSHDA